MDPQDLAEAHWMYVFELLEKFCKEELWEYKEEIRFMYISAFIHGFKHGSDRYEKEAI